MPDPVMHTLGHHLIPLLSLPGAAGAFGGKAHLAAVKAACKSAERIHGGLALAGRFELAIVPESPDFFDPAPGLVKARNLAWEVIRTSLRLQWVIPTRNPEHISRSLPPTWIGKGFQNVCLGLVTDGDETFAVKLEALRKSPVQHRAIFLDPSSASVALAGQLHAIDWVVLAGTACDVPLATTIESVCREAGVAFLLHRIDGHMDSCPQNGDAGDVPTWTAHPFGSKIDLFQPTLPDLKPMSFSSSEQKSPHADAEIKTVSSTLAVMEITDPPLGTLQNMPTSTKEPSTEIMDLEVVTSEPGNSEMSSPDFVQPATSGADLDDFTRLDDMVRRGLATFIEVGKALAEIRDRELWRAGDHSSWAAYCLAVGGLTKIHANRLIKGSEVASNITEVKPTGFTCSNVTPPSPPPGCRKTRDCLVSRRGAR
jgi:hypothetical protein